MPCCCTHVRCGCQKSEGTRSLSPMRIVRGEQRDECVRARIHKTDRQTEEMICTAHVSQRRQHEMSNVTTTPRGSVRPSLARLHPLHISCGCCCCRQTEPQCTLQTKYQAYTHATPTISTTQPSPSKYCSAPTGRGADTTQCTRDSVYSLSSVHAFVKVNLLIRNCTVKTDRVLSSMIKQTVW